VGMVLANRCHRQNMKTSIINGSEVSRLSVAIHSAITLRTSALAEFVKNVVKKKQSAAVEMLTILAAGATCLQLRLPTYPDPSWLAYFDSCNNRWTHSTKPTYLLD
ncbi:MAG: hypothetical protein E7G85_23960, partial [Citrobacter portucalensis]|nr:hypothetical protein [Citrobacter portucalensis]